MKHYLIDNQMISKPNNGTDGMVPCTRCRGCGHIISGLAQPYPTLSVIEPLDCNDPEHWACTQCGFSRLPAEWEFFLGHPQPDVLLMPAKKQSPKQIRQSLFVDEAVLA